MLAYKLRHRIRIEQVTETQDPDTGAIGEAWTTVADNVPAEIAPLSGREIVAAQAVESGARVRFTIRHGIDVTPKMRITHEGLHYNIVDVIPDPKLRHHLTIMTETGLRDG